MEGDHVEDTPQETKQLENDDEILSESSRKVEQLMLSDVTNFSVQELKPKSLESDPFVINKGKDENKSDLSGSPILVTVLKSPQVPSLNLNSDQESSITPRNEANLPDTPNSEQPTDHVDKQSETIDETKFESYMTALLKNGVLPPKEEIRDFRIWLNKQQVDAVLNEDYDRAETFNNAVSLLPKEDGDSSSEEITIEQRIENTKQSIKSIEEIWKNKLVAFEQDKRRRLQEMEMQHNSELTQLEQYCSSQEFLLPFDKPSPQLLQIRQQQRTRALAKDFQGAKDLKRIGDEMQERETENARKRAVAKMKLLYKQLTTKHEREIECAKQNWERQKTFLKSEREAELKPLKQLLVQLENNGHAPIKRANRPRTSQLPSYAPVSTPTTPRTRRRVAEFKKGAKNTRLPINPIDATLYFRPQSSNRSRITPRTL